MIIALLAMTLTGPAFGETEIGTAELQIAGTRLTVSPASQTVPFDTPTVIETDLEGYDTALGSLPPELRVLGDLTGPEVDGLLTLATVPGEAFQIPRLRLEGTYRLENIRLAMGDAVLGYAEPRDAVIEVSQILISRVSSRPLTLDEIRALGLVIDEDSFEAINLTFAYGVSGNVVDFNMPLVYRGFGPELESLSNLDLVAMPGMHAVWRTAPPRFSPPRAVPFVLRLEEPERVEVPTGGCDPKTDCRPDLHVVKPMVGVILFPSELSLLHQFFSVVLMVENGAAEGDPAVLRDLFARIELPPGLRLGETEPPTLLGQPVPVKNPGPDGELGTADDLNFLVAGAAGDAEVLIEGVRHGTHIVEFDIDGVLEGLPTGPKAIQGKARGAVSVRDPRLAANIAHPQVVRANVEYSMFITLTNIGNTPVNLISVEMPHHAMAGAEIVGANDTVIETLEPGASETVEFRVNPLVTGRVVSSSMRVGSAIEPSFEYSVSVGGRGALSSDALVLPTTSEHLPAEVLKQSLALAGLGYSLAQAPPSLGSGLPRVGRTVVNQRIYRLGQVGRHIDYGEPVFDALANFAVEWAGGRDGDWAWDQLRRESKNGGLVSAALADVMIAEKPNAVALFDRFATTTGFLAPQAVLETGTGLELTVSSRTSGKSIIGRADDPERAHELSFADRLDLGDDALVLLTQPESSGYRVRVESVDGGSGGIHILVPDAAGSPRAIRYPGLALQAGGVAEVDFEAGDGVALMNVDTDGDGAFDDSIVGIVDSLTPKPFEAIVAVQNITVDPSGHVVDVLFSEDVALPGLVPTDSNRFLLPKNRSNGGLIPAEATILLNLMAGGGVIENHFEGFDNPRVVQVVFDNPLSPFADHSLAISDLISSRGEALVSQAIDVDTRAEQPGIELEGHVYGSDGQLAPGVEVVLYERDRSGVGNDYVCAEHPTAITTTDANGYYHFGYVRQTPCGTRFRVAARDHARAQYGEIRSEVRSPGTTQTLDVRLPGRGFVIGRVTYEDGTVPEDLRVVVKNFQRGAGRIAHVGEDGNYDVAEIVVGPATVSADDFKGNFAYATVEVSGPGAIAEANLVLIRDVASPPGQVRGRVRLHDDTPVGDAWVALYSNENLVRVEITDSDGGFDFGPVPSGAGQVEVFTEASTLSGLGSAQLFFDIDPDQVEVLDVIVRDDRGSVQGRVYRRSIGGQLSPVEGAVVYISGTPLNTVTDATGFYRIDDVFAGTWSMRAGVVETGESVQDRVTITTAGGVVDRDLFIDAELPDGGLVGLVVDGNGQPVAGATVHLSGGYLSTRWWHELSTDDDGRFVLEGLEPGEYGVHAMKGGDGGIGWATVRFPGDTASVTVRFETGTITGQTLAPVGEDGSLAGVVSQIAYRTVEVYGPWELVVVPPDFTYIETDANGFFEIEALAGPYELHVSNAFHGEASARGQIDFHGQVTEHEFIFEPNGDIHGRVLDIDGETPVEGALVGLIGGQFENFQVHTDAEGRFHFPLVPPNSYRIQALFEDGVIFRRAEVRVSVSRPGQVVEGVEIPLPEQGSVSGWVEDSNGTAVPGAVVSITENVFPWRRIVQNSDEEGNFAFDNVFAGAPFTLDAQAPALGGLGGRSGAEVHFEAEDVLSVITLEDTGEVGGLVTTPVDGSSVVGAAIELIRGDDLEDVGASDDDGRFRFRLMPLGWYQAKAYDAQTGRRGRSEWVELVSNNQVIEADLELESRGVVTGRFIDGDTEAPLPGHLVQLRSDQRFTVYATTDLDGRFSFGGIPEGGFWLAARESTGRRSVQVDGFVAIEDEVVEIDLRLEPLSEVFGSVWNAPGMPAGLFDPVNVRVHQGRQVIGAGFDNPYRFDGLAPRRTVTVIAKENGGFREGRASGRISEIGDDIELDVTMQAIGAVEVTVHDSFGQPVNGASVNVTNRHAYGFEGFAASTGDDHVVAFADLRAGTVSARAIHPQSQLRGVASGELVTEGEVVTLAIVIEDTGFIRGTVHLPDGQTPAVAASVALRAGGRWLLAETDETGFFEFSSVPMGNYHLVFQENDGLGSLERFGNLATNGEVDDFGNLVLDDQDPHVAAIDPETGTRDLPLDTAIRITFSEPMDSARQGSAVRLRTIAGHHVATSFAWSADQTELTMTPVHPLLSGTGYDVFIETSMYDLAGRRLPWRVRSTFYTADVLPPAVIDSVPRRDAVQVPVDSDILVLFSEPVDQLSLSGTALQLTDLTTGQGLTTTFQLRPGDREVIVTPTAAFSPDHDIRLRIQNVADLVGNVMTEAVDIDFWTVDETPPTLSIVSPAAGTVFTAGDAIEITVDAADNRALDRVEMSVGDWSATDASTPYVQTLLAPVAPAGGGDVAIDATAFDRFGNQTSTSVTVFVEPDPNASAPVVEAGCWLDGDFIQPGVEIPLPYDVTDDARIESVWLEIDGEVIERVTPVDAPQIDGTFLWIPPHDTASGTVFDVRVRARDFAGNIGEYTASMTVPLGTIATSDQVLNQAEAGLDLILGEGTFTLDEPLSLASLTMLRDATLITRVDGLRLTVTGDVRVQCGATLDATAGGFAGGANLQPGEAPGWVAASQPDAGGSHGGYGRTYELDGPAGDVFDSVYSPHLGGGGGSPRRDVTATAGGGVVEIEAASITVDGEILARGGYRDNTSSGAGGTIALASARLQGVGLIDASGGDTTNWVGAGGGGRIALFIDDVSGFDLVERVRAWGGRKPRNGPGQPALFGSPGTLFVRDAGSTFGTLILANGEGLDRNHGNIVPRRSITTDLPALGSGAVVGQSAAGADLWITGSAPFVSRWLGAYVALQDASGTELGVFEVVELSAGGDARLADAGTLAPATFRGEYHFDDIRLHDAHLGASDPVVVPRIEIDGEASYPPELVANEAIVHAGGRLRPETGERLRLEVAGTLTIEAGGSIDVTGLGYAKGVNNSPGEAPDWVTPAMPDAGGSHGGGGTSDFGAGPAGEVYDSVYLPRLSGGGGAPYNTGWASVGGGVIEIVATEIVLDGTILANGEVSNGGGAGAGGSVLIDAASLRGAGAIEARAGDTAWNNGVGETGNGGGGRVALWVDDLSAFDVFEQVSARAGANINGNGNKPPYAAPGTILHADASATFGSLLIDAEVDENGDPWPSSVTRLPTLGQGAIDAHEIAGDDVWIDAAGPFRPRWLGAWMVLEDAAGTVLGSYRVADIDASGRARVVAAAALGAALDSAATWRGEYRFDRVDLRHGAGLDNDDSVDGAAITFEGETEVSGDIVAETVVVKAGAVVRPASGDTLRLEVTGTLTVEAGGRIDVTGLGYAGGVPGQPGTGPEWVTNAQPANGSGGGYGGGGQNRALGDTSSTPGETYGSLYRPTLTGSGGASYGSHAGSAGGGRIEIIAGTVQLDGEIRAGGGHQDRIRGGGAGGAVIIEAAQLRGSGLIDASGSDAAHDNCCGYGGNGGGGRVALWVDDLSAFDADAQVRVWGGTRISTQLSHRDLAAAPGTLFLHHAGSTFGELVIDAGTHDDGAHRGRGPTALPILGSGSVDLAEMAGPDLWVTSAELFRPRWLGAWMRLEDASGTNLGSFEVVDIDALGRVRLGGAATAGSAATFLGEYRFDRVDVRHGAGLESADRIDSATLVIEDLADLGGTMRAQSLVIAADAHVRPSVGGSLRFEIEGTMTVEAGAVVDVSGLGYLGAWQHQDAESPDWVRPATLVAGGSHGGRGYPGWNRPQGEEGEVYGSVYRPTLPGGGGGFNSFRGEAGGGVLEIEAATLVLDGHLLARGEERHRNPGGGAGGSIVVEADQIVGGGTIDASGTQVSALGSCCNYGGNGGGGRVALYVDDLSGFDVASQVLVMGGDMASDDSRMRGQVGAAGTLFVFHGGSTFGELVIDAGTFADGADRGGPATELPTLGNGAVTATEVDGDDLWIAAATPFRPRWRGVWVRLEDASGVDLGRFKATDIDALDRLRLAGAGSVATAATFDGEYRFDNVSLRHGAGFSAEDPVDGSSVVFEGVAEVAGVVTAENVLVRSGAVVRPASGSHLRFEVAGTLTVESGGAIDVSGFGYLGALQHQDGEAPDWVRPATLVAGGSHGGRGYPGWNRPLGEEGEIYDSVYRPTLPGGGGGYNSFRGESGGGVLEIEAAAIVLDGDLLARGEERHRNPGGGAGGSIVVEAGSLSGLGRIDASGSQVSALGNCCNYGGNGGGGRVALYVDDLSGFDAASQVRVWGGDMASDDPRMREQVGAPGTLFLFHADSVFGELLVDAGRFDDDVHREGPVTELPALGTGDVLATENAGTDLWITAGEVFRPRWLGAWMGLVDASGADLGRFEVLEIDAAGRARLENAAGTASPSTFRGEYRFDRVSLRNGAGIDTTDPIGGSTLVFEDQAEMAGTVSADSVVVKAGAVVRPASGGALRFEIADTLTVEAGGAIDVSGAGYAGAVQHQDAGAPDWVRPATGIGGGAHGGAGYPGWNRPWGGEGEVYGSVYLPNLSGGGGGFASYRGENGGGVIEIVAANVVLDGDLLARGEARTRNPGGGAGGSIVVTASSLTGAGLIDASGTEVSAEGQCCGYGGNGGGGRIALYVDDLTTFDTDAQVRAWGGYRTSDDPRMREQAATPGTILIVDAGSVHGDLVLDVGVFEDGAIRDPRQVELPALGTGTLSATEVAGDDLFVSAADVFRPRWRGAWMVLEDAAGTDLGRFRVLDIDADGRARLEGASAAQTATAYRGEYRFDAVSLRNGTSLLAGDRVVGGSMEIEGDVLMPGVIEATDLRIKSGATVRLVDGNTMTFEVAGAMIVEAGATIDVSGMGFAGGIPTSPEQPGETAEGAIGSELLDGASHGGSGALTEAGQGVGEIYGNFRHPDQPGAGGGSGRWGFGHHGSDGGGLLVIRASTLALDGALLARGAINAAHVGGGAGGAVVVETAVLTGTGTIDTSGTDGMSHAGGYGGNGGGGRVALLVDDISGFDVGAQVEAHGGARNGDRDADLNRRAGPGTVYVNHQASIHGDLWVRHEGAGAPPVTFLPSVGRGEVGAITEDGADLWIEPLDPDARFDVGVEGLAVRIGGTDHAVLEARVDRRAVRLEGAAGSVAIGDAYIGVVKLDNVHVRGGARLEVLGILEAANLDVDAQSSAMDFDLEGPVFEAVTPSEGALYAAGDTIDFHVELSDESGIAQLTFELDGQVFVDTESPFDWQTTAPAVAASMDVPLTLEALDVEGNLSTFVRHVRVEPVPAGDPPTVTITRPRIGALLAPATGVEIHVDATDDHEVARVELYIDGALSESLFSPPWVGTVIAPATATDGAVLTIEARAFDFADQNASDSVQVTIVDGAVFSSDSTIAAGDTSYEGQSVIAAGGVLTLDGDHSFRDLLVLDGATVTHSAASGAGETGMELTIARDVFVAPGGAIDANGKGYPKGMAYPGTADDAATSGTAGSHGGRGGDFDAASTPQGLTYGSLFDPATHGAGAYGCGGCTAGGGVIRLLAAGEIVIEGRIEARGGNDTTNAHQGAGGSIRLDGATIRGTGSIDASGGGRASGTGGGGGGRVAIYAGTIGDGLLDRVLATGGAAQDARSTGAAGTIFVKDDSQVFGDLIIDNGGQVSDQWTILPSVGHGVLSQVVADAGTARIEDPWADFRHSLVGHEVAFGGDLGALWAIADHPHRGFELTLDTDQAPLTAVAGDAYEGVLRLDNLIVRGAAKARSRDVTTPTTPAQIESGSTWQPSTFATVSVDSPLHGSIFNAGESFTIVGVIDDDSEILSVTMRFDGQSTTLTSSPYEWTVTAPVVSAQEARTIEVEAVDLEGRLLRDAIDVQIAPLADPFAPEVTLAGCPSDLDIVPTGANLSLAFTATDNEAVERYSLLVDGVAVATVTGLNQAEVTASVDWTVPAAATPGTIFTLTLEARDFGGGAGSAQVRVETPGASARVGDQSLDASTAGQDLVLVGGVFTATAALDLASLTLAGGAVLTSADQVPLEVTVAGDLRVQCDARIDVEGGGFPGSTSVNEGTAPAGIVPSGRYTGGSHGGAGTTAYDPNQVVGDVYDSVYMPTELGASGGRWDGSRPGGAGGGIARIEAQNVVLDGVLTAAGQDLTNHHAGAGAGGTVWLEASTLSGIGHVDVSGGDDIRLNGRFAGLGGGGRAMIAVDTFSGFDPLEQVVTRGGRRTSGGTVQLDAAAGTLLVRTAGSTYGDLVLNGGAEDRGVPATELPPLGTGAVTLATADGDDLWLTADSPFRARWLGVWVTLIDATGAELGHFEAIEIAADGRLRLAGAATVTGAATYRGDYRFDQIHLLAGAGLEAIEPIRGSLLELVGDATVDGSFDADEIIVRAGARVTPVSSVVRMIASGDLTVESGAVIDVSGAGHAGGSGSVDQGGAPAGMTPSGRYTGGSHGGIGTRGYSATSTIGEVFGSVYRPRALGGGGGRWDGNNDGGNGGGSLQLVAAGTLTLDGELLARGQDFTNSYAGAGAGGSVSITAGTLTGIGTIDASGGDDIRVNGRFSGVGGGGRIAIEAGLLVGFEPVSQARAEGGSRVSGGTVQLDAAAGTIFVRSGTQTRGELIVDGRGAGRDLPATDLPSLGTGAILSSEAEGVDLWIAASASYRERWLGTWVTLSDASGIERGSFEAIAIDALGRLRLAGASAVTDAVTYRGDYRFDRLILRGGAGIETLDLLEATTVEIADNVSLPAYVLAGDVTVTSGAVLTPTSAMTLHLDASGTVEIVPGGAIDLSGHGFAGGAGSVNEGGAPSGFAPSGQYTGGSHGGTGARGLSATSAIGDIFGSVYVPTEPGGGGGRWDGNHPGGAGGGALRIDAASLVLDGEIRSRGEDRTSDHAGAGAGGSVAVFADTLSGAGSIDASGGDDIRVNGRFAGLGGGGRVALHVGNATTFDPIAQVFVEGGSRVSGSSVQEDTAPGTVLFRHGSDVYGGLIVDARADGRPVPATWLPALGDGAVTSTAVEGADLWLTAAGSFDTRWLGVTVSLEDTTGVGLGSFEAVGIDAAGRLRLDGAGTVSDVARYAGAYRFDRLTVRGGANLGSDDAFAGGVVDLHDDAGLPSSVVASALTVRGGARVTPTSGSLLDLDIAGRVTVESGAMIDVSGAGHAGGSGNVNEGGAPAGRTPSGQYTGGSHGGEGTRAYSATTIVGETYGSVYLPTFAGGGGGRWDSNNPGGAGGGVLRLQAAELVLDGDLMARGEDRTNDHSGAGAGGSIVVAVDDLSGLGSVDASGGDDIRVNGRFAGLGGGGRVAIYAGQTNDFDAEAQVRIEGGVRTSGANVELDATPGTAYLFTDLSTYGTLVLNGHVDRILPVTTLPRLGDGEVVSLTDQDLDAWIEVDGLGAGQVVDANWLGAWIALLDTDGAELGVHRLLAIESTGRLLLEGAAGVVDTTHFRAEYRFDTVRLLGGAGLDAPEPVAATTFDLEGPEASLPPRLAGTDFTVRADSRVVPASVDGFEIALTGTLTVESGGTLDASGRGFAGGTSTQPATTQAGVATSGRYTGGSHGGPGTTGYSATEPVGDVYDSVYFPDRPGAGGGYWDGNNPGGGGGGRVIIAADAVVLEGDLLARGADRTNDYSGAGAGGTVSIVAAVLSGAGLIDASGGDDIRINGRYAGLGGGGRVRLEVTDLTAFDPATQVHARPGARRSGGNTQLLASPGTLLVVQPADTFGHLTVDAGPVVAGIPPGPTPLPAIGSDVVGTVTVDASVPDDLWIEPLDAAATFDHGVVGAWIEIAGTGYRILALSSDRRGVLLAGAAATVVGGESYAGVYRFDSVTVLGGAQLTFSDADDIASETVDADSSIVRP